eukprot:4184278-Pyramimonas_sp.AAC.1
MFGSDGGLRGGHIVPTCPCASHWVSDAPATTVSYSGVASLALSVCLPRHPAPCLPSAPSLPAPPHSRRREQHLP